MGLACAEDFPQEGDLAIAALLAEGVIQPEAPWTPYAVLVDGVVVGTAGFKGAPTDSAVEIGYGIVPSHRRRGVASAAVAALLAVSRAHGVVTVTAETEPDNLASQAVLIGTGFTRDDDRWWSISV